METSTVNEQILRKSLELATEMYINYVNKFLCGGKVPHLCEQLLILKGSKVKKEQLKLTEPELHALFTEVWKVRGPHHIWITTSTYGLLT